MRDGMIVLTCRAHPALAHRWAVVRCQIDRPAVIWSGGPKEGRAALNGLAFLDVRVMNTV